jgi:hypothetical protein
MSGKALDTALVGIYLAILLGGATTVAGVVTLLTALAGGFFVDWYKAQDRNNLSKGSRRTPWRQRAGPGPDQPPKQGT